MKIDVQFRLSHFCVALFKSRGFVGASPLFQLHEILRGRQAAAYGLV